MPRRRELNGIVKNFASFLSGRNNDHLGYWAVGQLYSAAKELRTNTISLSLMDISCNPESPLLKAINQSIRAELDRLLNSHSISLRWIARANVEFTFNAEFKREIHYWRSALGEPFLTHLEIETDLSFRYRAVTGGNVKEHDPNREQRRNGF